MCSGGVGEKRWQRTSSKAGAGSSRRDCCQRRLCCLPAAIASFPPHFTQQPHLPPLQSLRRRLHHPTSCRCHRHSFHRCLLSSPLAARADFAACPLPLLLALPPSPKLLPLPPLQSLRRRLRHPTARAAVAIATAAIAAGCQRQLCCLPRCHCFPPSPPHTHTASPAPARKPAASPAPPHSPPLSSPLAASTGFDACPLPLLLPLPPSVPHCFSCTGERAAVAAAARERRRRERQWERRRRRRQWERRRRRQWERRRRRRQWERRRRRQWVRRQRVGTPRPGQPAAAPAASSSSS